MISLRLIRIRCLDCSIEGIRKKMYYYLNEYSLRGQFKDEEEFFDSLRKNTLPALKRIQERKDNVIWKSQTLWACQICEGITLRSLTPRKNERNSELAALKQKLMRISWGKPFWSPEDEKQIFCRYQFDTEYCKNFAPVNCFTLAIENDGRIFSFKHEEYEKSRLAVIVQGEREEICELENVWNIEFWDKEPQIETWWIDNKYRVEVRANEFDYHPPHFHVLYNEYAIVFRLKDGALYRANRNDVPRTMLKSIASWYSDHKDELKKAWGCLHT